MIRVQYLNGKFDYVKLSVAKQLAKDKLIAAIYN
jgi:hypothetical protein